MKDMQSHRAAHLQFAPLIDLRPFYNEIYSSKSMRLDEEGAIDRETDPFS